MTVYETVAPVPALETENNSSFLLRGFLIGVVPSLLLWVTVLGILAFALAASH